ncbi:MAG: metallophosphoesterase [Candidatus Woesearchaeota archaeon]
MNDDEIIKMYNGNLEKIIKLMKENNVSLDKLEQIILNAKQKEEEPLKIDLGNKSFYYCYFADPHIGHKQFNKKMFDYMVKMIKQKKPDFVINVGDTLEGMSGRDGHIYELEKIGFDEQFNYAVELLSKIPVTIYGIDGNHDMWYHSKFNIGIIVGKKLEEVLDNYVHLGQMDGSITIDGIKIKLFHANDKSAFGMSYQIEKLIDALEGENKPNILHSGHYHKYLYIFRRNIHAFESGTLCNQTLFMKGKKIVPYVGFGFVKVYHNKNGEVSRIEEEFYTE